MYKTKLAIVAVGIAALGAAGAGTAFASTNSSSAGSIRVPAAVQTANFSTADAPGGPDVQQGDQTTPDTASDTEKAGSEKAPSTETSAETPGSETAGASDGPGGYADPAGSNADTQQQGEH